MYIKFISYLKILGIKLWTLKRNIKIKKSKNRLNLKKGRNIDNIIQYNFGRTNTGMKRYYRVQ